MTLQINKNRSLVSQKLAGAFLAVFALFLQPLVSMNIPAVFALGTPGQVVVNEFSSNNGTDWVELYNKTDTVIDLTSWELRDSSASNKVDLSGSLPAAGIVSFDFSNYLNVDDDTIRIINDTGAEIDSVTYGTGGVVAVPVAGEFAARITDGSSTWELRSTNSRNASNNLSSAAPEACNTSTFDAFVLGSVNGQGGWTVTNSAFDQEIVDNVYGYETFGCKALRLSNSYTSGSFGDQTFSAPAAALAGEDVVNDRFEAEFSFGSTIQTQQSGLALSVSPDDGSGNRISHVSLVDAPGGIAPTFYDTDATGVFRATALDIVSRDEANTIKFIIDFVDGENNDVVEVYLNGVLAHTGTTWEQYYRHSPEQAGNGNIVPSVDRLLFRLAGSAAPANAGNGFLFDGVEVTTSQSAPPDTTNPTVTASLSDVLIGGADANPSVTIDASDDESGIDYVQYKVMNHLGNTVLGGWVTVDNGVATEVNGVAGLADGNYVLRARAFDVAGNKKSGADVPFVIDTTAPEATNVVLNGKAVSIARTANCGPVDFNLIRGKVSLGSVIADSASGVKNASYKIRKVTDGGCTQTSIYQSGTVRMSNQSGDDWVTLPGSEIDTDADTNLEDGNYTIMMTVGDNAGNTATNYVDITVDNTAPVAKIVSHNDGDSISGVVTLIGEVEDIHPMNTHFAISGPNGYGKSDTKKDSQTQHSLTWDVSALPNGEYTVRFETRDLASNKTSVSVKKIKLNVNNPQPVVNGENFNTHSGIDYKGLNIGFNIAHFNEVTGVTVELFNGEASMVANTHNQALLDLINGGTSQLGTPFITVSGTYTEEYWNLGTYDWSSISPRPTHAVVAVTGTNNAGQVVTETAQLTDLSEPNGWTFAGVLPELVVLDEEDEMNEESPTTTTSGTNGPFSRSNSQTIQPFSLGFLGGSLFGSGEATDDATDDPTTSEDDGADVLGTQDGTDTSLDNPAVIDVENNSGNIFGQSWQIWLGALGGLIVGWLILAAIIRRIRGAEV